METQKKYNKENKYWIFLVNTSFRFVFIYVVLFLVALYSGKFSEIPIIFHILLLLAVVIIYKDGQKEKLEKQRKEKIKEGKEAATLLLPEVKAYVDLRYESPVPPGVIVYFQEGCTPNENIFNNIGPSFSEKLFSLIKQQGFTETECYKNSNIDRKLFSKIRSDKKYSPSKTTVLSLIIGLKLNLNDAESLLGCAGFSLSHSIKQDVVIEYAITKQIYDIHVVNEILYSLDCRTLGSRE